MRIGGHNIYRGSNRRFRNKLTDRQTEFTVIISSNVAANDVALHAVTDDDRIIFVMMLLSYRNNVELLEIKVVMLKLFPTLFERFLSG